MSMVTAMSSRVLTSLTRSIFLAGLATAMLFGNSLAFAAEKSEAIKAAEARMAADVKYLASDEMEGRGVGTDGLNKAAQYLAAEFAEIGLHTDLFEGSPFQTFTVTATTEMGKKESNQLALIGPAEKEQGDPQQIQLALGDDFTPLAIGGSGKLEDLPLVFVGYGITAPHIVYDDYADLDVKGKVVVMLRKEPQQNNPHSKFDGKNPSQHATFNSKVANAFEHGAAAVIIVNDAYDLEGKAEAERKRWQAAIEKLTQLDQAFRKIERPTEEQLAKHLEETEKLSKQIHESVKKLQSQKFDEILTFEGAGIGNRKTMPVFFAAREKIDPVITAALDTNLQTIEEQIDKDLKPRSAELAGWKARGQAEIHINKTDIKNVVAVLEGEGPLADETVIVGAHYDHLGMGGRGTFAPWTVAVHNGADDNASGTAALLEVARRLAQRDEKPRRRIMFIAFTGEERGLLGSAHYVKNPRFPLEKSVAMINMDMVGRLNEDKLVVHGTGTADEFDALVDRLNENYQFKITKKPGGFGPSDHASFYPKKIPVLHLFTGTHKDYHRPSDDWEKVNVEGMRRVAEMVTDLVDAVASADARPTYKESKRPQLVARGGSRPYLGTIPDFANDAQGYAIQGVAAGGPSEKAGMKGGDVIVKFGESKIGGLEDIDSALRKFKAGDKVKVVVQRDGKDVELEVVLDPPR